MGPEDVLPVSRAELEKSYDEFIADPSKISGGLNSYYRCKDGSRLPFESTRRALRGRALIIAAISRDIGQAHRGTRARFTALAPPPDVFNDVDVRWCGPRGPPGVGYCAPSWPNEDWCAPPHGPPGESTPATPRTTAVDRPGVPPQDTTFWTSKCAVSTPEGPMWWLVRDSPSRPRRGAPGRHLRYRERSRLARSARQARRCWLIEGGLVLGLVPRRRPPGARAGAWRAGGARLRRRAPAHTHAA